MKNRIISLLLAICLCAALLPTTALATDYAIYSKEPVVFQVSGDVLGALKSDNSLWTWGRNSNGAVGNGKEFENYYDFQHTKWIEAILRGLVILWIGDANLGGRFVGMTVPLHLGIGRRASL